MLPLSLRFSSSLLLQMQLFTSRKRKTLRGVDPRGATVSGIDAIYRERGHVDSTHEARDLPFPHVTRSGRIHETEQTPVSVVLSGRLRLHVHGLKQELLSVAENRAAAVSSSLEGNTARSRGDLM